MRSATTRSRTKITKASSESPEASWGYENDPNADIWRYSTFNKSGAYSLAKTMRDKFGCTIVESPYERENGTWGFAFTNPLRQRDDAEG